MKKGVIFDMDGTLWDAADQIVASWNQTILKFPEIREGLTRKRLEEELGKPMDQIATSIFPYLSYERAVEIMNVCGEDENQYLKTHGAILYEGLEESLKILAKEYPLYIVSNCQRGYIEAFLEHYQFWGYFQDIECYGNTLKSKGHNIQELIKRNQIEQAVYVGDTKGDYEACLQAEIPFIWASYGFGTVCEADAEISCISELSKVLNHVWKHLFS